MKYLRWFLLAALLVPSVWNVAVPDRLLGFAGTVYDMVPRQLPVFDFHLWARQRLLLAQN